MKQIVRAIAIVFSVINFCMLLASELPHVRIIKANVHLKYFSKWQLNDTTDCSEKWNLFGIKHDDLVDKVTPVVALTVDYPSSHRDGGYKSWMYNVPACMQVTDIKMMKKYQFPEYVPLSLFFIDEGWRGKKLKEEPVTLHFKVGEKNFAAELTITNKEQFKQTSVLSGKNIFSRSNIFKGGTLLAIALAVYFYLKR